MHVDPNSYVDDLSNEHQKHSGLYYLCVCVVSEHKEFTVRSSSVWRKTNTKEKKTKKKKTDDDDDDNVDDGDDDDIGWDQATDREKEKEKDKERKTLTKI